MIVVCTLRRRLVQVTSPHMFTIGDTSKYSAYVRNGIVRVVGEEKTMNFVSDLCHIWCDV